MSDRRPFLTARWQHLVMLNFAAPADCLAPLVPIGTELDEYEGRALISVVAFEFAEATLFGLKVPGYQLFPEVNLRFYVRRWTGGQWRRGVVFIQELVPRRLVARVARYIFGQNFGYARMFHRVETVWQDQIGHVVLCPSRRDRDRQANTTIRYCWQLGNCDCHVRGEVGPESDIPEHAFVAEHYYAYAACRQGTVEYLVEHPRWRVYQAKNVSFALSGPKIYGQQIGRWLLEPPSSVLIADGSAVAVYHEARFNDGKDTPGRARSYDFAPCS
jgi:uncharacterized protein YqjF (DUF2071 family)